MNTTEKNKQTWKSVWWHIYSFILSKKSPIEICLHDIKKRYQVKHMSFSAKEGLSAISTQGATESLRENMVYRSRSENDRNINVGG